MPGTANEVCAIPFSETEPMVVLSEVFVSEHDRRVSDEHLDTAARDAQTEFIQANLRRIFLLIYRIVGNVDDAQDLTQETFIKALQRQSQLKDLEKVAHWLSRIASNTAIDFLRRHGRVNFSDIDEIAEPLRAEASHNPEHLLLRAEQSEYLEDGLRLL